MRKNAILLAFACALVALAAPALGQPTATPAYERYIEIWYNSTNCDNSTAIVISAYMRNCSAYQAIVNAWNWTPSYEYGSCRTTNKPPYGNAGSYYAQCGTFVTADVVAATARALWPRYIGRYSIGNPSEPCQPFLYAPVNTSLVVPPPYVGASVYTCVANGSSSDVTYWNCPAWTTSPSIASGCTVAWSDPPTASCAQGRGSARCEGTGVVSAISSGAEPVR
jgi:hypothetical protein